MEHKVDLFQKTLINYRNITYHFLPQYHIHNEQDAVNFVNERGMVFFWPIKDITFPSLWGAAAGDRPVPNNHDDPGHITWRWKDSLLDKRQWYYAKIFRQKSTIISLKMIKYFFALSTTVNQTYEEIEYLYRIGKMTIEEKFIYTLLDREGPLDSIEIRNRLAYDPSCSEKKFDRAMALLQRDFRILPTGVTDNGRWHYAYLYDLVQNYYPDLIQASAAISNIAARTAILLSYLTSNGAGTVREIRKILHWEKIDILNTLEILLDQNFIQLRSFEQMNEEVYMINMLTHKK